MPRMDGTGPMGAGARTGRGRGNCAGGAALRGSGMGRGRGYAWRVPEARRDGATERDLLAARKAELERRLAEIECRMEQL